ncbi:hypothetical protein Tco_1393232 [Tanacetum coccineum]
MGLISQFFNRFQCLRSCGQNLWMKICFNSSQFFACSGDVLSNHLLAIPTRVRGNTRKRAESFALNKLAISSTFLICSIAFLVELHEKVVLRNSLKNFPWISNVASSGLLILLRVLLRLSARYCSSVRVSMSISPTSSDFDSDDSDL